MGVGPRHLNPVGLGSWKAGHHIDTLARRSSYSLSLLKNRCTHMVTRTGLCNTIGTIVELKSVMPN